MEILFIITVGFFAAWEIRNIFFWTALWQLKEYRFDRVSVHLNETRQGKFLLFSPLSLVKWAACFFYILVIFEDYLLFYFQIVVFIIYTLQVILLIREYILKLDKKPVFTAKALIMIGFTCFLVLVLLPFPLFDKFFWILLLDRISAFIITFVVFILSFPTEIHRDLQVQQAADLLAKRQKQKKEVLIIGVTGSYGKSSTKEYIAQILQWQFNVLSTKGTNNTPIGIANTIKRGLKEETEIFVVEMGAYKIGEIAGMCDIVHPEIGVLTAVNEQHLALFGSLENTKRAKYELIESLPKHGIALFNGNNDNALKLFKHTKKRKVLYGVFQKESKNAEEFFATDILIQKEHTSFTLVIKGKKVRFTAPLLGAHTIENMIPGIYIAQHLGMPIQDIKVAVSSLTPIEKTMIFIEFDGKYLIDDTFNANPEAVIAAVKYMNIYKKQKFLVMQPMIELGKQTYGEHYRVAKFVSTQCDYLLVTNKNYIKAIQKGLKDGGGTCELVVGNTATFTEFLVSHAQKGDIIVFEGKEAYFVLDRFKQEITG